MLQLQLVVAHGPHRGYESVAVVGGRGLCGGGLYWFLWLGLFVGERGRGEGVGGVDTGQIVNSYKYKGSPPCEGHSMHKYKYS